jgi:hypothetical protein
VRKLITLTAMVLCLTVGMVPAAMAAAQPTCGGVVGVVHGHHIVGDYVTGEGHDTLEWPPAGKANARGGAALAGGPGPAFHFVEGFAPGASFCVSQSRSPGFHIP